MTNEQKEAMHIIVALRAAACDAHSGVSGEIGDAVARHIYKKLFGEDALREWGMRLTARFDSDD